MKKRLEVLIALLLSVVLVATNFAGLIPGKKVFAASDKYIIHWEDDAETDTRVGTYVDFDGVSHSITFTKWTATDSLPSTAGNYYLANDVSLNNIWFAPSGETTICLNGKCVSSSGNCIKILGDNKLNIFDSVGDSGVIKSSKVTDYCAIYLASYSVLNLYSGNINESDFGIKAFGYAKVYIYNAKIYGCNCGLSNFSQTNVYFYGGICENNSTYDLYLVNWQFNQTGGSVGNIIKNDSGGCNYVYVTLEKNDGSNERKGFCIKDETTPIEDPFTRDGYTFLSWNTEPDGSGTSYSKIPAIEQTLYAQWEDNSTPDPTPVTPEDKKEEQKETTDTNEDKSSTSSNSYQNEWVDHQWYDANGNATYKYKGYWKKNSIGWWFEDEKGWYPQDQWQKIDGKWYFFDTIGYMAQNEYAGSWGSYSEGNWWVGDDGAWDGSEPGVWRLSSNGKWWFKDSTGWYAKSKWYKIRGTWYYFDDDGWWDESKTE